MPAHSARPMIGVTLPHRATAPEQQRRERRAAAAYRRALEAHGARVLEVRPDGPAVPISRLDALLLTGGGDVDPKHYGQRPHPKLGTVEPNRDHMELRLARSALRRGLPVLGICRGAQVLGIALGGQLVQDIPSLVPNSEKHSSSGRTPEPRHWLRIAPDSRLRAIARSSRARVNSSHHQANAALGRGVRAVAWSEDGVIEAIEANSAPFVIGVQWHPERMWRRAPRQGRLLAAFVSAARAFADSRPKLPERS